MEAEYPTKKLSSGAQITTRYGLPQTTVLASNIVRLYLPPVLKFFGFIALRAAWVRRINYGLCPIRSHECSVNTQLIQLGFTIEFESTEPKAMKRTSLNVWRSRKQPLPFFSFVSLPLGLFVAAAPSWVFANLI